MERAGIIATAWLDPRLKLCEHASARGHKAVNCVVDHRGRPIGIENRVDQTVVKVVANSHGEWTAPRAGRGYEQPSYRSFQQTQWVREVHLLTLFSDHRTSGFLQSMCPFSLAILMAYIHICDSISIFPPSGLLCLAFLNAFCLMSCCIFSGKVSNF
jgi:hypothetical protein